MKAHGKHTPGEMNKLEAKYATHLTVRQFGGGIKSWRFEPLKLKLAPSTFYTPDFWIVLNDDTVELHEVKATWGNGKMGWQDDARVKIKVAASMFHEFKFRAVTWHKQDGWKYEEF